MKVKVSRNPLITVHRNMGNGDKLVYIASGNRRFKYRWGKSCIVYIGMTRVGGRRIAASAAEKASIICEEHNCKYLEFYVIKASGYPGVALWEKLERALIIRFRELMGDVPRYNKTFKYGSLSENNKYFNIKDLDSIIQYLSPPPYKPRKRRVKKKNPSKVKRGLKKAVK